MKILIVSFYSSLILSSMGCNGSKVPSVEQNPPIVSSDKNPDEGENPTLDLAGVKWILPSFLQGKLKESLDGFSEATSEIELRNNQSSKFVRFKAGFQAKACNPEEEKATFIANVTVDPPENIPDRLKTDFSQIQRWTANTSTFKGQVYFKKRFKAQGDTALYRMDVLISNEKTSECALWNLVFTPPEGTSTGFIEGSDRYLELSESFKLTWKDLGLEFEE